VSMIGKLARRVADDAVAATFAGLVVALIAVTTLTAATVPDRGPGSDQATPAPVAPWSGTAPVTAAQAPDGGVLRVVEQGFSLDPDPRGNLVSYGLLLENTSRDRIAFASAVTVRMLDAAGAPLKQPFGEEADVRHTVYAVFPGQRFGIGAQEWLDRRDVASLAATVDPPTWVPVDQPLQRDPVRRNVVRLGTLSATDVLATITDRDLTLVFTASSGLQETIRVGITVVLRDGAGRVIGGAVMKDGGGCPLVEPGQTRHNVSPYRVRAAAFGADQARTEVFLVPFGANLPYGCT
jgi:hypothetical protein